MQQQEGSLLCLWVTILSYSTCLAETLSTGESVKTFVKEHIAANDVMVFAKSYCRFSKRSRALLEYLHNMPGILGPGGSHNKWSLNIIDINRMPQNDGPLVQAELLQVTGQRTVPNIFIQGQHIGGNSMLRSLNSSGILEDILKEISAQKESPEL